MASGAGSKGGFVGNDSNRKKIRQMRCEHSHIFSLEFDEINFEQKHTNPESANPPIKALKQGIRRRLTE